MTNPEVNTYWSGDIFGIAEAIAIRAEVDSELTNRISASLQGEQYVPMPEEVRRERILANVALNVVRVENPHRPLNMQEAQAIQADTTRIYQLDDFSHYINAEGLGSLMNSFVDEMFNKLTYSDERIADDFAVMLEHAHRVAAENQVTVAEVYTNDDLYYEARSRIMTPEKFAIEGTTIIDAITPEIVRDAIVRSIEQLLPKGMVAHVTKEDLEEAVLGMQLNTDTDLLASLEEITRPTQEAVRQIQTYIFLKTYGYEELLTLAPDIHAKLAPQQSWAQDVFAEFLDE